MRIESIPEFPEPVLRIQTKAEGRKPGMPQHVADDFAQSPFSIPAHARILIVAGSHGRVAVSVVQSVRNDSCREHSGIKRMPHPFPTEWINHSRSIPDRNEV